VRRAGVAPAARGRWIPWAFVAFFVVVATVNGVMIWLAAQSYPGLVTERPYDHGLAYNQNLEAAAAQAQLGWQTTIEARLVEGFEAALDVVLLDRGGRPLDGAVLIARLGRPAETSSDFELELPPVGPGRYATTFPLPMIGAWDVHLVVIRGGDRLVVDRRVVLR
jgi:nitrogen fixation protein FixH